MIVHPSTMILILFGLFAINRFSHITSPFVAWIGIYPQCSMCVFVRYFPMVPRCSWKFVYCRFPMPSNDPGIVCLCSCYPHFVLFLVQLRVKYRVFLVKTTFLYMKTHYSLDKFKGHSTIKPVDVLLFSMLYPIFFPNGLPWILPGNRRWQWNGTSGPGIFPSKITMCWEHRIAGKPIVLHQVLVGGDWNTGWFSHVLGISSSQLTNSYFSEGWNHQPGYQFIFQYCFCFSLSLYIYIYILNKG